MELLEMIDRGKIMIISFSLIALGLPAGGLSGLIGIGGGTMIVTTLIFLLGFSQDAA